MKHSTFVKLSKIIKDDFKYSCCEEYPTAILLHEENGRALAAGCYSDFSKYCYTNGLDYEKLYSSYRSEFIKIGYKNAGCSANARIIKKNLLNINRKLNIE